MTKTMITSLWKASNFSIALFTVEGCCIWLQRDQDCLFVFVTCSLSLQNPFQLAWGCPVHLQLRVILQQSSWALKTSSSCLMTPRNQSLSPSVPAQSHTMARPPWTAAAESTRNPKPGEDFGFGIATLVCGMKEAMVMVYPVCLLLVLLRYKGRPSEDDQAIQNCVWNSSPHDTKNSSPLEVCMTLLFWSHLANYCI